MGLSKSGRNEDSSNRQKKIVDVCDVHSKVSQQEPKTNLKDETKFSSDYQDANNSKAEDRIQESDKVSRLESNSSRKSHEPIETDLTESADQTIEENKNNDLEFCDVSVPDAQSNFSDDLTKNKLFSLHEDENKKKDVAKKKSDLFPNSNKADLFSNSENAESDQYNFNESSLPDIISTLNKTPKFNVDDSSDSLSLLNNDRIQNFSSLHNSKNITESVSKIPSVSATRSAYLPYLYNNNSDVLNSDIKNSYKISQNFQPSFANNSIYKLAFDESLTDQSDTESRSPSPIERCAIDQSQMEQCPVDQSQSKQCPVDQSKTKRSSIDRNSVDGYHANNKVIDPESQVPSSLMSHEINVFEAGSDDDAGSEDLELIPHRYESESFLNKNKHLYENKLSLAVELLRTKESLPYDAQFKRVIEDSQEQDKTENSRTGKVNRGFVDDLNSLDSVELNNDNFTSSKANLKTITNQCKTHNQISPNSVSYGIPLDDSLTNSYELADEVIAQSSNHQENREEMSAGYRRIGVQFRHSFSPSSTLVNPWNCCIIM